MSAASPAALPVITLAALLRALPAGKLESAFGTVFGDAWQICDGGGVTLSGKPAQPSASTLVRPIRVNHETVGTLELSNASPTLADAAVSWLGLLLDGAFHYRLAANLFPALAHEQYEIIHSVAHARPPTEAQHAPDPLSQHGQHGQAQIEQLRLEQYRQYQNEKMKAIGSLAAGMAHEINNPAGFVKSNLNSAAEYVKQLSAVLIAFHHGHGASAEAAWKRHDIDGILEEFPGLLTESVAGVQRIANIASCLDSYARIKYDAIDPVDVNRAVSTMASIINDRTNGAVSCQLNLAQLPTLMADESRINQMLLLILQNGVEALAGHGVIEVTSTLADGQIRVALRDRGCGIAAENLSRIFDPFFTTRDVGKGMGLGLTISRDIAAAHGGGIDVDSSPGQGSVFTVWLPLANGLTGTPMSY